MKVSFIGLGNMGSGMVANLLKHNYEVLVNDINPEKVSEVVQIGAEKAETIEKLSKETEVVILCLPHPDISKMVIKSLLSSGSSIKTIIDTSTLTPYVSEEIYKNLKTMNINFLCAPMLGGKNAAEKQLIHFLVEGQEEIFSLFKDVFSAMGKRADYMGAIPNATVAKLAYNICRYGNIALAAEVSRFVRQYSQETEPIYNLLTEGSQDNFGQVWKEDINKMILEGVDYKPSKIPQKDLSLIKDLLKNKESAEKLIEAIKETYKSLEK